MGNTKLYTATFIHGGRRYYVRAKTKREADRRAAAKRLELERNEIRETERSVRDWAKECIDTYKPNLSGKSLENYRYRMELYVLRPIGDMKLKQVRQIDCQKCLNLVADKSKYVIDQTYQMLNFIFTKAVENEMIRRNPVTGCVKPRGYKSSRRALKRDEADAFTRAIKKHAHGLYFAFIYYCGCRPSESARIQGRDIQMRDGVLSLHIRGTKSKAADRWVPIPDELAEMLPDRIAPTSYASATSKGNPLTEGGRRMAWKSLTRLINIEMGCKTYRRELIPPYPLDPTLTTYCLRHTYCTNLAKAGVDIRTAQYLMGHSSIEMTANIYTHIDEQSISVAAEQIKAAQI